MVKNTKGGSAHKKQASKSQDEDKVDISMDKEIEFGESTILVLIDKNLGNCYSAKILYPNPSSTEVKILHQRGKAKRMGWIFKNTRSKIALVSVISGYRMPDNCIGVVEHFVQFEHLDFYNKSSKITEETFNKLTDYLTVEAVEDAKECGFDFDRDGIENI